MITLNRVGETINVFAGNKDYFIPFTEEVYTQLLTISDEADEVETIEELNALVAKVEEIANGKNDEFLESTHGLWKNTKTGNFHIKVGEDILGRPIHPSFNERIQKTIDEKGDVSPIVKFYLRFLRNKKRDNCDFEARLMNYMNMKYVRPDVKEDMLEQGYTEEKAVEMAIVYQVKLTKEGLINCYKVSEEIDELHTSDEDGNIQSKPLYNRTFDAATGKITGDDREDKAIEERVFIPGVVGTSYEAFYCEGPITNEKGHIIRVGHTHRLESWDSVDCNDNRSCVKGLHVGGLSYISCYSGDIHNVFVDPANIGAICDDQSGAMRVLEYFVHSSMVAVNSSIYHSSTYAAKGDEAWKEEKKALIEELNEESDRIEKAKRLANNI